MSSPPSSPPPHAHPSAPDSDQSVSSAEALGEDHPSLELDEPAPDVPDSALAHKKTSQKSLFGLSLLEHLGILDAFPPSFWGWATSDPLPKADWRPCFSLQPNAPFFHKSTVPDFIPSPASLTAATSALVDRIYFKTTPADGSFRFRSPDEVCDQFRSTSIGAFLAVVSVYSAPAQDWCSPVFMVLNFPSSSFPLTPSVTRDYTMSPVLAWSDS